MLDLAKAIFCVAYYFNTFVNTLCIWCDCTVPCFIYDHVLQDTIETVYSKVGKHAGMPGPAHLIVPYLGDQGGGWSWPDQDHCWMIPEVGGL